jgi:hypothetical protein
VAYRTQSLIQRNAKRTPKWDDQLGNRAMTKLPYVRTMFATGMLFQVIYVACVLLWFIDPQSERALVAAIDFSELYAADNWKLHLWPDRERPVRLDCRDHFCVLLQSVAGFSACFVRTESGGQSKLIGGKSWLWISEAQLYVCV